MSNIGALDVVLELGDLLLELVQTDLVVLNDERDLELADTVADGDELGRTPDETLLLDPADLLLERLHVGLVVPRLDLAGNKRLRIMSDDTIGKKMMKYTLAAVFGLRAFFAL